MVVRCAVHIIAFYIRTIVLRFLCWANITPEFILYPK